ncbi:MAG: exonuclease VII small subunit [Pelagibacteraceae bacterium BACL5 MAG-120705-bin12]|jgi:CO dehydrogenase/acetyl-CoA synthase alpha subunit|uniref:exonuclease VII small subunit n=1 Tax=Candidatus Pelagibacter sp. TaxID=2024849 RepID=UPI0001478C96|nr:MAG: exonuclease VII small subunit [Pelagibacteraceae bacterium BACL5 MAG-120705-bin12]KRO64742.1 MAG: exonuclease VII small subunit [Pelagibacteraceae bacterium BACL5 MAG-120820-bin39]KRO75405.1 MAG: exonuclease VII small subunit [Pelagibacteraceae bacterium BACL5 MAG-120813-bin20]MDA1166900.1 exonuclease VII small subunit [Pseudomonadota bacterium]
MKDKNLTNNYNVLSLEDLTIEADKLIKELENEKDLESVTDNYQKLLNLNILIEKKFQKNSKTINQKTKEKIFEITSKKNAK